ncbi:MAG: hypothetical protein H7301_12935 [Cryobacterium sp.]|nr:hypothetical protein [Oligoflexia bacterium]
MSLQTLFPTQIYRSLLPLAFRKRWIPSLVKETKLFRDLDDEGRAWSREHYYGGYTSYSSITDLAFRSSGFADLKQWIDREVKKYASSLELDLGAGRLEMSALWLNTMGQGCHHSFHLHPLSTISGTFYLQVPKGSGEFKIEDPRLSSFMASPPRKKTAKLANLRFFSFIPRVGEMVLFESWLKHEVTANQSTSERISVSFNYDWIPARA